MSEFLNEPLELRQRRLTSLELEAFGAAERHRIVQGKPDADGWRTVYATQRLETIAGELALVLEILEARGFLGKRLEMYRDAEEQRAEQHSGEQMRRA